MVPHARPNFELDFDVDHELSELANHLSDPTRAIPARANNNFECFPSFRPRLLGFKINVPYLLSQ